MTPSGRDPTKKPNPIRALAIFLLSIAVVPCNFDGGTIPEILDPMPYGLAPD
jgi:hypothetical protein